ncbi:3-hydroxyacyl-CoA dehydrogenase [Nocardia rhizosphaerihabitans]|uniref:3-hydroxybutyryl-CoA dehydrogenase n=1 Tax=Nocardia rhizosphaerihabitans TaxID=1691570 RepID=A0ABQ2L2I6_9NOCA|nr:3-hydroxyacyl-CoA dehydrogenase [Nocardia rhizosphaerihabitans]GGO00085.1 3-hydroxybutyryl-CoA dehydrogenase [Nocardia rhizosphaerihabitans]
MSDISRVTVLGAGVLGGQIAWHSAFKGKTVVVYDVAADAIARAQTTHRTYAGIYLAEVGASEVDIAATWTRLSYSTDLAEAVADVDLVIEAVPEVPGIKTSVYKELADLLPAHTLIATNSSTFLPRDFAAATGRPEKFCALHFANMIWAMNLAEVMAHPGTARDTLSEITEFAIEIGMVPIPVRKENNGYVINAWVVPLLNAAQTLVTNGIALPEDIDRTFMVNGARFGPMGMFDIIGMKTVYDVLAYWGAKSGDAQMGANAAFIKERFLDRGKLGLATGSGYYTYPDPRHQRADFLAIPDVTAVPDLVDQIVPS